MPFWPPSAAGTRPSRGEGQEGVQDTCGFLYPLLRLPLIFRWPRKRCFAAKNEESTDFTSVLSFFCVPWLCDCVVCRA